MPSPDNPPDAGDQPANPADRLPSNSVLDLDDYVQMYAIIGHRIRYEILYRLVHTGDMNMSDFTEALSEDRRTVRYHLNRLLDAGLVQRRQCTETGDTRIFTYYRATILGEVALSEGIEELIRGEQEFPAMYNSSMQG